MSTSGTDTITATRDIVVRRALRMVGAFPSTDLPRPEQTADAITVLNCMLKEWSINGFLWLRQFVSVTLVAGQGSYDLGPASTVPMDRPTHIFNCNRKSSTGYEVPLVQLTRTDYMAIPNKSSSGTPVQYYYDSQTTNGKLYVWPVPSAGTTDTLYIDCDRQLDVMVATGNDYDFPPQWLETIAYMLAARLAPEYGVPLAERDKLEQSAIYLFNQLTSDDRDLGSVKFEVRRP